MSRIKRFEIEWRDNDENRIKYTINVPGMNANWAIKYFKRDHEGRNFEILSCREQK